MICNLCPQRCGADRAVTIGVCGCTGEIRVAKIMLHHWEEPCISGSRGSGAVFFSGCPLKCVYCQNFEISRAAVGQAYTVEQLYLACRDLADSGAHNINLVSPTPYVDQIIQMAQQNPPLGVPLVYNTGGYERVETLRRLEGTVDVYLTDLKYADSAVSAKYSKAPDYFEAASAAALEMARQTGRAVYDEEGLLQRGLIVRHLVLPGQEEQAIAVINWVKDNLPEDTVLSLMCQYIPSGNAADHPELSRTLTEKEYNRVLDALYVSGIEDGYVQDLSSADAAYVPDFEVP